MPMKIRKDVLSLSLVSLALILNGCDRDKSEQKVTAEKTAVAAEKSVEKADVLPYLNIQEQPAKVALPFCENKNCIDVSIQTLITVDPWINQWIEQSQAYVVQAQVEENKDLSLQQAVNAYVKKSDTWQAEFVKNKAYELSMYTRIPYQRNQYVLMQIGVDTQQEGVSVKDRHYFFVADRRAQKSLSVLDIIDEKHKLTMNDIVQTAYAKWLTEQTKDVQKQAPKKLYWGQSNWFFDEEGIGLHYRPHEIIKDGEQLDIYFSKQQTQQVLKPAVYQLMF